MAGSAPFIVTAELPVGTRIERTDAVMARLEAAIPQLVPEMTDIITSAGGFGGFGPTSSSNRGTIQIMLTPKDQRTRSSDDIARELRRQLAGIAGVRLRTNASGGNNQLNRFLSGGGPGNSGRLSLEVRGDDLADAAKLAVRAQNLMDNTPGIADARVGRDEGRPELSVRVDRPKAALLGLSPRILGATDVLREFMFQRVYLIEDTLRDARRGQREDALDGDVAEGVAIAHVLEHRAVERSAQQTQRAADVIGRTGRLQLPQKPLAQLRKGQKPPEPFGGTKRAVEENQIQERHRERLREMGLLDKVRYDNALPWTTNANGTGASIQLIDAKICHGRVRTVTRDTFPSKHRRNGLLEVVEIRRGSGRRRVGLLLGLFQEA